MASPTSAGIGSPAGAAPLAPHRDLAAVPVEVIECERGRLPRPQAQAGQEREDGEIAPSHRRVPVTAAEQRRHHLLAQAPGQAPASKASRRGNRRRQLAGRVAGQEQEPQQRPQPRDQDLGRRDPAPATLLDDEARHLAGCQVLQVEPARPGFALAQEQPGRSQVGTHGALGQTPLAHQIAAVVLHQQLRSRAGRRLRRGGDHAQSAQVAQQRRYPAPGQFPRIAISAPRGQELLDPGRGQVRGAKAAAIQPAAQMRKQSHLVLGASRRVTPPGQLCSKAVPDCRQRAAHANPPRILHGCLLLRVHPGEGSVRQPGRIM